MNRSQSRKHFAIICISLFFPISVSAHHSFQAFDADRTVTIEGVVTDFDLKNPHIYLTLDVTNDQGEVESWEIESVAANLFRRIGGDENTFVTGEKISVVVNPARNSARRMAFGSVFTKSDGSQIVARGAPNQETSRAPVFADSIEGIWTGPSAPQGISLLHQPVVKDTWPVNAKGLDFLDAYNGSQTDSVDCVSYSAPMVMIIPGLISVDVSDTLVTIQIPNESAVRHIYVDGRTHPEVIKPTIQGHSIGRWEGGALLIDTISFAEHQIGNARGLPSGAGKRLTERLALNEDRSKLDYSFTLEDPEYLTQQVTRNVQWSYSPNEDIDIEPCDPETAARFLNAY